MSQKGGYPPGTHLSCKTTLGAVIKGNVIATDESYGTLVIKEGGSSGSVHVINLRYLSDLTILASSSSDIRQPLSRQPVSLAKVRKRLEGSIEARRNHVQAFGVNVSPEAQQLFNRIRKIYSDIRWDGQVIVVLGEARISPPYTPESVSGSSKVTKPISKLLMKYSNGDQNS